MNAVTRAHAIAFGLPALLMAGALGSQYIGGLIPCEMCWWQRWPHYAAIVLAGLVFFVPQGAFRRILIATAAGGVLTSGLIGVYHAGVEYHWWQGMTACTSTPGAHTINDMLSAPLIRCDQPQWTLFGISLAGFNALLSIPGALLAFWFLLRGSKP